MPANGLLYKAPDACGCYPKTKTKGFFAASSRRVGHGHEVGKIAASRLQKGPAFGEIPIRKLQPLEGTWLGYRRAPKTPRID